MPVLTTSKHEQFALHVAKGASLTKAYILAGYSKANANSAAHRLCANVRVCARIRELQQTLAEATIALEISNRNARVKALQERWDWLRAAIDKLRQERGADMADVPGGSTGLLCRDFKGKDADREISRVDNGLVNLLAALRAHEEQAAKELGQWTEKQQIGGRDGPVEIKVVFVKAPPHPELSA